MTSPTTKAGVESSALRFLSYALDEGKLESAVDPTRLTFLRVSSFPFCQRQWFINKPQASSFVRREPAAEAWFLHIGTTYHALIQEALSYVSNPANAEDIGKKPPGRALFIANWECPDCGTVVSFAPHPKACTHCKYEGAFVHVEHRVSYKKVVRGHMDGCIAYPPEHNLTAPYSPSEWLHYPFDIKTCSAQKVKSGSGLPYIDNVSQLSAYGAIKSMDGYNVPGTILIYCSRDNPHQRRACYTPLNLAQERKNVDLYVEQYKEVSAIRSIDEVKNIKPIVDKDYAKTCTYCTYTSICESASKGNTKPLMEQMTRVVQWQARRDARPSFPD